jgi:hypothetical protein
MVRGWEAGIGIDALSRMVDVILCEVSGKLVCRRGIWCHGVDVDGPMVFESEVRWRLA